MGKLRLGEGTRLVRSQGYRMSRDAALAHLGGLLSWGWGRTQPLLPASHTSIPRANLCGAAQGAKSGWLGIAHELGMCFLFLTVIKYT